MEIPDIVKQAFYPPKIRILQTHKGVDPKAVARAIVTNLKILGQVVPRPVGHRPLHNKLLKTFSTTNEVFRPMPVKSGSHQQHKMEQVLSRANSGTVYEQRFFWAHGLMGVAAASLHHFAKPSDELNVSEGRSAALPKAPEYWPSGLKCHEAAVAP